MEAVRSIADISDHESRPLTMELVNAADLIIGMTKDHKSVLLRQFPFEESKIKTISEWGGQDGDVTDPYGSDQTVYNQCAEQIYHLVEAGLASVPSEGVGDEIMKVAIGCDHGGLNLKVSVKELLNALGHEVEDFWLSYT